MTDYRYLSGKQFAPALALLKARGVSANEQNRQRGCGNNQPRRWAREGAPLYIALALSALLAGLPPWRPSMTAPRGALLAAVSVALLIFVMVGFAMLPHRRDDERVAEAIDDCAALHDPRVELIEFYDCYWSRNVAREVPLRTSGKALQNRVR